MSFMQYLKEAFLVCAKADGNVISICEEAFYLKKSSHLLASQIDSLTNLKYIE
jgi:hypothetical protein